MDFADFEKSSGFLVRCADMLRNQGFAGIVKNGANFRYVMRTSEKMTLNRDYCCFQKSRAIFMT